MVLHVGPLRIARRHGHAAADRHRAAAPTDKNKRGEIKLTGTVAQNHTIQGGYLNNPRTRTNNSGRADASSSTRTAKSIAAIPNWYYYANYRGVLRSVLLVEAQYSERRYRVDRRRRHEHQHHRLAVLRADTAPCLYNAPYFDATDPKSATTGSSPAA